MNRTYAEDDLRHAERIVRELHGIKGFDAWAEHIAKELSAAWHRGEAAVYAADQN